MYIPEHFKETRPDRLSALIESHPFGMLVTAPDGVPCVSHLPLLYDRAAGPRGKLIGHLARANPQWQHLSAGSEVLAIFQGPHAYVSPSWYATPGVPTWNYAVVHLRGVPRLVDGGPELATLLERLTRVHESAQPSPWQPALAGTRQAALLDLIVGFEIDITDVQGKFKLSQNRPAEDRQRVIDALNQSGNPGDAALARLMSKPADAGAG